MYFNEYGPYVNHGNYPYRSNPYMTRQQPIFDYSNPFYPAHLQDNMVREQSVRGEATWTEGGSNTACGIPWSTNNYMTVAVGTHSPYECGQTLRIKNLSSSDHKEISVKVVDKVPGFPANKVNLHRRAFIALGADPEMGIMQVEIIPSSEMESEQDGWSEFLSKVIQTVFPGYQIINYRRTGKTEVSAKETKETFAFTLQSHQETKHIEGTVHYRPDTGKLIAVQIKEV